MNYQAAIDTLAFIQRHPGHGSQKVHGHRYGAKGERLEPGKYKKKDVVKGGKGKAGGGSASEEAGSYDFPKDDKGLKEHYNLTERCKKAQKACEGSRIIQRTTPVKSTGIYEVKQRRI